MKYAKKHGIAFKADIVTNGYFLMPDKFDFMFGDDVYNIVQIPFDGTEKEYFLRKGTGAESYVRVSNNMLFLQISGKTINKHISIHN